MRIPAAALCAGVVLLAGGASAKAPAEGAHNVLTSAEKASGWKLLFDGQTTKGWRNFKQKGVDAGWKVQDGALVCVDPRPPATSSRPANTPTST
ncbi:hypothetical protein BH09PSE2_BH09PSE2_08790 [soil metagenome]